MKNKFLLFLSVVFLGIGQIWGQTTVTHSFSSAASLSGSIDDNIDIEIIANSANAPAYNSGSGGHVRLYSHRQSGDGNELILTTHNDAVITAVSIVRASSSGNPSSVTYSVDDGTRLNFPNSVSGITANSTFTIKNEHTGGSSNIQLHLSSITVTYEIPATGDHTITVIQPVGGEITPGTTGVDDGGSASFTATVESSCYTFSHWIVDGENAGNTNPYIFTNVTEDHTISAVFEAVAPYTITATAGANGSISPSGAIDVDCGADQAFTITADSGYAVADVLVNGVSVGAVTTYTFEDVTENQTISASFEEYTGPCVSEDFENIPTSNSGSYQTRTWTGTNGGTWNATNARTDQTINGKAITTNNNGTVTSPMYANGMGTLKFNYVRAFTGTGARSIEVYVNGVKRGNTIIVSSNSDTVQEYSATMNISGDVQLELRTSGAQIKIDDIEWTCYSSTPTPQITVTPSGNHDFGNQLVGSTSTPETFTITNTGNADLTIGTIALSGADAGEFSVTPASSPVTQGNTTTFTVSFSPTSLGSKTATVTIPNNDEDYTFTVTGTGSYAAASDIATNTDFTYTNNILYANYQTPTITNTSNSVGVFQFAVRDGGGDNDGDDKPTTLTGIAFNYTGSANTIRAAALFNVNGKIADGVVTANGISFSGLNIVAPDNDSSPNITLRVSFTETVTDKEKLVFTVASATADASGSVFAQADAGGAFSDNNNGNNRNRIEVVADRLAYATQPSGTSVNTNLAAFVIAGVDQFGNTDLDATNTITLTTSGTGMTASPSYTLSNGTVSISDVQFNTSQTGITLTATTTGLVSGNTVTSAPFDISDLATGTYRTTSNGTWPSGTATWERLTAGGWNTATPASNANDLLIIRHAITTNNNYGAQDGQREMIIENGGRFVSGHACTFGDLVIKDGGEFEVLTPQVNIYAPTGKITVENGGKLILNSPTLDNSDDFWAGIENFHPESILEIKNWDWGATGTGNRRLIGSTNTISTNSEGYYFGHIHFDATVGSDAFVFVQPTGNHKLCNDLIINNGATSPNVILTIVNANIEIAGDVIAEQNTFSFGSVGSSTLTHTVHGNIIGAGGIINLNQTSAGAATVFVDVKGNVDISSTSQLTSSDDGCKIIFSGEATTPQTISIAGMLGPRVDFEVANGAEVHLINQHLDLTNSTNDFTVLEGGSLYFNYLNTTGSGKLTQNTGGILKITDANGIQASGASGNVQSAREFSQTGHFHYVGNVSPQSTGNVMTSGSTAKRIVINKDNVTDVVNLASSTGTSNELYIAKGIFTETEAAHINGSGNLTIDDEGYYRTAVTSNNTPRLSGTYTLANNSTVELNANADQSLNHDKSYGNLIFSNGGTTTSGTTPNIAGTVTIKDATTLNVSNNTFGGATTNLTMENTGVYINGGSGVKPDMGGSYTLANGTTIDFTGSSATQIRVAPKYANVIVSGTNVTAGSILSPAAGLRFQDGGSFTVKDGATFKVNNPDGFTGSTTASIKNAEVLAAITLEPNSTIEYNGNGAQTITDGIVTTPSDAHYENLIISGAGAKTLPTNPNSFVKVNNDFTVNSGEFIIETGKALSVKNRVTNNAVANNFIVENDASLVQINDVDNIGDITAHRNTQAMVKFDATYWSSPVAGQKVKAFSQGTLDNRFYIYNGYNESETNDLNGHFKAIFVTDTNYPMPNSIPSTWYDRPEEVSGNLFVKDEYTFKPGWGYSIRVPNNWEFPMGASGGVYERQFIGVPHNGDIEVPAYGKYTMVGNPYPSAIEIEKFFDQNLNVATLHFWTHVYDVNNTNYNSNYSTVTGFGGAGNTVAGSHEMNENIEVGQGFVVEHSTEPLETNTTPWPVNFKNDMRIKERGVFQKQNNSNIEKHRFWLNVYDTTNDLRIAQVLLGYMTGATNEYDHQLDGRRMGSAPLYSLIDEEKYTVQARALPFLEEDVIALGISPIVSGNYKIEIDRVDGLFAEGQEIYLKDNYLQTLHNLSLDGEYEFEAEVGEFHDRFEIVFMPEEVMETIESELNDLLVYHSGENLVIESKNERILSIELYDLNGKSVHRNEKVNAHIYQIRRMSLATQVLIVKVLTENGEILSKKIINH